MSLADCVPVGNIENILAQLTAPVVTFVGVTVTQGPIKVPGISGSWAPGSNPYVTGIQFEYRESGGLNVATRTSPQGVASAYWQTTNNIIAGKTYEVWYRATTVDAFGPWVKAVPDVVAPSDFVSGDTATVGGIPTGTLLPHIPGYDVVPPAAPTSLSAIAAFQTIFLSWLNPADTDLKSIQIWENTIDNRGTATLVGTTDAAPAVTGAWARSGLVSGASRYYWIRAVDMSGNIGPFNGISGTIGTTATLIFDDFTAGIKPIGRGSSLPTAGTYLGDTFFNTTDAKLYRKDAAGTGWQVAVAAVDISGQIVGTQITDLSISTPKLAANAVTTAKIDALAVTANELAANSVIANKIAAGVITASHIASNTITAAQIAAATITSTEIAAGTIAADRIVAYSLDTTRLAIGGVELQNMALGAATKISTNVLTPGTDMYVPRICAAITFTNVGGMALIDMAGFWTNTVPGDNSVRFICYLDGTPIFDDNSISTGPFADSRFMRQVVQLTAGTNTFLLYVQTLSGITGMTINSGQMTVTELRKAA